jgi:hypothetical protein
MKQLLKYVAITASLLGSASVYAAPLPTYTLPEYSLGSSGTYNGKFYRVYESSGDKGFTWIDANYIAKEVVGGHLATITSAAENNFVFDLVKNTTLGNGINEHFNGATIENMGAWLGARRGVDGKFNWVTGEAFTYTNWLTGEPNDFASGEDYLHYYFTGEAETGGPTWNDYRNDGWAHINKQVNNNDSSFVRAFVVESSVSPVPVPAAAFLFAPALIGFIGLRRKAANKA